MASPPVRVAIVNDYEIVVRGLATVLAPFESQVVVVEIDSRLPVAHAVDVVLFDTFGQVQGNRVEIDRLTLGGTPRVAVFTWNLQPALVRGALERGVAGYLSKGLTAERLVEAIVAIHAGTVVVPDDGREVEEPLVRAWPGREHRLSPREAEVVALITQGMSNQQIADTCYLSVNSVKTYVRTAYRKMGVSSRSRAVLGASTTASCPTVPASRSPTADRRRAGAGASAVSGGRAAAPSRPPASG